MTSENNLELFKLDATDRMVLFWMMDHNPQDLRAWIEYIASQYVRGRNRLIDADKLFSEVIIELPEGTDQQTRRSWRPKNVLLIDDEAIFNFLHTRVLELTGVTNEIQTALNGKQAIALLKELSNNKNIPDVILLDLAMPVMDGFAFLEAFKKLDVPDKDRIAIIVLTSSMDERDRVRAKHMGITHYLTKPVDERELCVAVISS